MAAIVLTSATPAAAGQRDGQLYPNSSDTWSVAGTLDGVRPGGRTVRRLYVSRIGPGTAEGLAPLAAFKDLRVLELESVSGVDLAPLAELDLDWLSLRYVRDVDLAPLSAIEGLDVLFALNLRDVRVPPTMALPPSLSTLGFENDGFRETGAPVKALIEAIDWTQLAGLRSLALGVGDRPITVDLGFLRGLPRLVELDVWQGVHHKGTLPSPLAPPFDGLAAGLRSVTIDAWRRAHVKRALERRYPRASVAVYQRVRYNPAHGWWSLLPPTRHVRVWMTYGRLWEAFDGRYGTEYEALQAARRRLRRVAPGLLARLEFDQEADGTGISSRRRRPLARALRILGIR